MSCFDFHFIISHHHNKKDIMVSSVAHEHFITPYYNYIYVVEVNDEGISMTIIQVDKVHKLIACCSSRIE